MGMFPRITRRRLAWAGVASAVGTAGYMLYKLYSTQEVPEEEQTNCVDIALGRTALEDGLTSLDASCKAFEASLQRAVQRGDTVTANRLRSVLRRAYATMETLNSSFGIRKVGAADRLSMAGTAAVHPAGEPRDAWNDHDDLDDGASAQDWYDAQERLTQPEQDLSGFDGSIPGKMMHVADIPAQPRGVDIWAEGLALARAGKIKVRLDRSKYTGSSNEIDFLARVHCFREATSLIGRSAADKNMIRDVFMKVVTGVLVQDDQDPSGWVNTVDACIRFTEAEVARDGGAKLLKELQTKQLGPPMVMITPYDLLFDYALFEIFDMVTNPPKAVMNALQSSWVPTAVRNRGIRSLSWTMLRAIRAVTPSNTFHSYFYALVHQALPSFTIGLLGIGTPGHNDLCRGTQMLMMQCTKDCFQIPGSVPHLTTELYAKKMLEVARMYTPRAIQMVARAVKDE